MILQLKAFRVNSAIELPNGKRNVLCSEMLHLQIEKFKYVFLSQDKLHTPEAIKVSEYVFG